MSKQKTNITFFIILIALAFLYNYQEIIDKPAYSIHTWRQSDCLSITTNFYKENLSFFTPKIHWTNPEGDNHVVSEFPIIYYLVGNLWKIFGQHYSIYRIINILLVFCGLFHLFKLAQLILKNNFWSFYTTIFLFTSPLLVYYSNNFLADAPAFAMSLTGIFYLYKYIKENENKNLILTIIFLILAGLLKISSLIVFVAFLGLYSLNIIAKLFSLKKISSQQIRLLSLFSIPLILVIWYSYARYYTEAHNGGIFLQGIYPIWDLDKETRHYITERLYWKLIPTFFNKQVLGLLVVLMIINIICGFIKKLYKFTWTYLISIIGIVCYFVLWYKAFDVHDYYLTNLLFFVPYTLLFSLLLISKQFPRFFNNWKFKTIMSIGLLFLVYQTTMINRLKYNEQDTWLNAAPFLSQQDKDFWGYINYDYKIHKKAFESVTPYLRKLGIKRNDIVISLPDGTINHTLFLMDQRGYSGYGYGHFQGENATNDRIAFYVSIGAKYLILDNQDILNEIDKQYTSNQIGSYQNILIYKLTEQ